MKVQTDVKAGGLLGGLINITAVVIVNVDVFGGNCCYNRCGGGC